MPITSSGLTKEATQQLILDMLGTPPTYEVDSVSVGAATAGSVVLVFVWDGNTYTTPSIAFNATNAVVAAAVQAATSAAGPLPAAAVVGSGGPLATAPVVLSFQNEAVGPVTGQTITPTGLTGGTATFTRTTAGSAGGVAGAIANSGGGANPGSGFPMLLRGADGKMYHPATISSGDGIMQLGVFLEGGSAQGNVGSGGGVAALHVASRDSGGILRDIAVDSVGNLSLQSSGTDGSPNPSKTMLVGGSDGTNLQAILTDTLGKVALMPQGALGAAAPTVALLIGGKDNSGNIQAANVSTAGAIATMDAGTVPNAPLSVNGVAFTYGQAGAPAGPVAVTETGPFATIPDSSGVSAINGLRGEIEVQNIGNVDVTVCDASLPAWGAGPIVRAGGGYLRETYQGPVTFIHNHTNNLTSVSSSVVAQIVVREWA